MGRRWPRMRYSGPALHLAQSPLTAPFCCQRKAALPREAVIQNPTRFSGFSRLAKTGAAGLECPKLRRELARRWARRGCLGHVKGGWGGARCRPFMLGSGGRSLQWLRLPGILGRQGCCVWSRITRQIAEVAARCARLLELQNLRERSLCRGQLNIFRRRALL